MVNVYAIVVDNLIERDKTTKNVVNVMLQKMFTHENTTQGEHRKTTMPFLMAFTPDGTINATTEIDAYVWSTLSTVGTKPRKNKYLTRWLKNKTVVVLKKMSYTQDIDHSHSITTMIRCAEHDGLDIVIVISQNTFDEVKHVLSQYGATTMYLTSTSRVGDALESGEFHKVHGVTMTGEHITNESIVLAGTDQNVDTVVNNFVNASIDPHSAPPAPQSVTPEKPYNCEHTVLTHTLHEQNTKAAKQYLRILEDRRQLVRHHHPVQSLYMGTGILALGVGILFPTVLPVSVPAFLTLLICLFLFTRDAFTRRKENKEARKNFGVYWSFQFSEYRKQMERVVDQWVQLQRTPCGEKHDTHIPYELVGIENMKKNPFIMLALPAHTQKVLPRMEHFKRQLSSGIYEYIEYEKANLARKHISKTRAIQWFTASIIALFVLSIGLMLNGWNAWALIPVLIASGLGYGLGYNLTVAYYLKNRWTTETEAEAYFNEATVAYGNFELAISAAIQRKKESQARILLDSSSSLRDVRTRHNEIVITLNDPETREMNAALTRPSKMLTEFSELVHTANELAENPYSEDEYMTTVIALERAFVHLMKEE